MAGTWQALGNQPTFNASTMLLLTDGSVMCQNVGASDWHRLVPDASGSYINGTWSNLASGPNAPLYYASAVLRDGRVFVAGGEYNNGVDVELLAAEIYDPVADAWTSIATPAGWIGIGDAACCVFPDGRVMLGHVYGPQCAIYDPVTNAWTAAASKNNTTTNEETWTLLPDQTIMTVDCAGHPQTEKYIIASDRWINCGATPNDLIEAASIEVGSAVLLPDGRLFAIGATGFTALYTMPPVSTQAGTWTSGPTFPTRNGFQLGQKDAPACLLPNGKVLCAVGGVDGQSNSYLSPTFFYEYDPGTNTLTAVPNPPTNGGAPYTGRMLLLPTGQVLFSNGSTNVQVYTPDGTPDSAWKPHITNRPISVRPGFTYTLSGRQLNGLSQAVAYGDDATMATNYPIVRIRNLASNHIFYCRTFNFSTLGVQTGTVVHSTQFRVPAGIELGASELCVIANGISSDCVSIGVSNKGWKEIKWEIKEFKELKENLKPELDVVFKNRNEFKDPKELVEGDDLQRFGGDPEWFKAIRLLAERSDEIETQVRKRSFIREEERPAVGEEALQESAMVTDEFTMASKMQEVPPSVAAVPEEGEPAIAPSAGASVPPSIAVNLKKKEKPARARSGRKPARRKR